MDLSPRSADPELERASTSAISSGRNGAAANGAAANGVGLDGAGPNGAAANGLANSSAGGKVVLNRSDHTVKVDGTPVALSPREFELLAVLMESTGRVLPSQYLMELLWGPAFDGDSRALAVYMYRLRAKLGHGDAAAHLRTVRSIGYAFDEEPVRY